jgi:tetratricopeptide (TPR) repeat protein
MLTRLLTKARALAERAETRQRIELNASIARTIRDIGEEAAFGDYVHTAFMLREAELRRRHSAPEWHTQQIQDERERREAIENRSKNLLLSGRIEEAEEVYPSAEELRDSHEKWGSLGALHCFLRWMVEDAQVQAAEALFDATVWAGDVARRHTAAWFAQVMAKQGHRDAALRLLKAVCPKPGDPSSFFDLLTLGKALWKLEVKSDAISAFREAAKGSLSKASDDPTFALSGYQAEPVMIARYQIGAGDIGGAIETLRGVLQLKAPLAFNPPPPRPAYLPPTARWLAGATIKPESERWIKARGDLARLLAWVGLDEEAFALLGEYRANQAEVLVNIIRGYSDRGSFDEAFANVQALQSGTLTTDAEPGITTVIKPSGEISTSVRYNDTRRIEDLERKEYCRRAAFFILGNAARHGDVHSFQRANALGRLVASEKWDPYYNGIVFNAMVALTERQGADFAEKFAEASFDGESALVWALDTIAITAAGLEQWDPLWP